MKMSLVVRAWVAVLAVAAVGPATASATFPGKPGYVAFSRSGPGQASQLFVGGRGGGATALTSSSQFSFATSPDWTSSGAVIAFTGAFNAGDAQVFTIRPSGGGLRQVTDEGGIQPAVSANGRFILYSDSTQPGKKNGIYRINIHGGAPHLLVAGIAGNGNFNPAISPNGRIFAFESGGRIFTARMDGSHVRRFAGGVDPDFSPNGRLISYTAKSGLGQRLVVRSPSGGGIRTVYDPPGRGHLFYPAFSPDGKSLSFQHTARAKNAFTVRLSGRPAPRRLFNADASGFFYEAPAIQPR